MSEEIIKFKGNRFGLQLVFDAGTPFPNIEAEIRQKLETGSKFFRQGTVIQLPPGILSEANELVLRKLFHQHGVLFRIEEPESAVSQEMRRQEEQTMQSEAQSLPKSAASQELRRQEEQTFQSEAQSSPESALSKPVSVPKEQKMLVINRTIRGGEEIQTMGSVLICGNVNPSAQIIAGGSIDIRGTCRGSVHAGAYGDASAFVIADCLMPIQIRIADRIAQAPDLVVKPIVAEKASIQNGSIVIEPIER